MRELKGFLFNVDIFVNTEYRLSQWGSLMAPDTEDHFGIPVRLSAEGGFLRAWCGRVAGLQTILCAQPAKKGETPHNINGLLLAIYDDDTWLFNQTFGHCEKIPIECFESLGWQELPKVSFVYLFQQYEVEPANIHYPILQSFLDTCLKGYLEYGEDFAIEFLSTTFDWNQYWINDRVMARRPWIHCPNYDSIDRLLAKYPKKDNAFRHRKLAVEYSVFFVPSDQLKGGSE